MTASLGFRAHSGWAAAVALSGPAETPAVILRRRLELADCRIAGSAQLFHAMEGMRLKDAEAYLQRCSEATRRLACTAMQKLVEELAERGFKLNGACLLLGSGRPVGALAATLASHPLIHTAEGEFYRGAIRDSCASFALKVTGIAEKELPDRASASLAFTPSVLTARIADLGKTIGPPWRADEKLCSMAAWLMLLRRD